MTYFLITIISAISLTLIVEAGSFLSSGMHGYSLAFLLESLVLVSMISKSETKEIRIFQKSLIAAVLIVVTGAASLQSMRSVVLITAPESVTFRISEVNRDIASLEASLQNLKGQPKNSAITSGKIRELLNQKSELLKQHRPDARMTFLNWANSAIPVLIRILLQIGNLFLITVLKNRLSAKPFFTEMPQPCFSANVIPSQQGMIAGFTGNCGDKNPQMPGDRFSALAGDEKKICDYIRLKGNSITHKKLLESKQLPGNKYETVLNNLINSGHLTKNDNGNKAFHIYALNNREI